MFLYLGIETVNLDLEGWIHEWYCIKNINLLLWINQRKILIAFCLNKYRTKFFKMEFEARWSHLEMRWGTRGNIKGGTRGPNGAF